MRWIQYIVIALFLISEIALSFIKNSNGQPVKDEDKGSLRLLWTSVVVGVTIAIGFLWVSSARIPVSSFILELCSLILLIFGLAIRWTAILTLGKLFTVNVAVHNGHALIDQGIYRFARHPSYTGLLMAFLGLGLFSQNWLSSASLLLPFSFGIYNRVIREEQVLHSLFGQAYTSYCKRTKRFFPGIF